MKEYVGWREADGTAKVVIEEDGARRRLRIRLDLSNHSPTGFEWGYGGSGPAQLALAILADALNDDERALRLHQRFKFAVIGNKPRDSNWRMSQAFVKETAEQIEIARVSTGG